MNTRKQQGFTIIEVVLVLAIAGLIFLMVFIALPALQRGQRDTARKNDVSTVASALNTYRSNNKGSFTNLTSANIQSYIDSLSQFDTTSVTVVTTASPLTANPSNIYVVVGAKCGTVAAASVPYTTSGVSSRAAIVVTGLENNGSTTVGYCQDV